VPELRFLSRNNQKDCPDNEEGRSTGALRLRVLHSLPGADQAYLFEEVQKLCRDYLRNRRIPSSEITPEDLLSEVWAKFLGTTSLPNDDEELVSNPTEWTSDPHRPQRGDYVVWLHRELQEMCGSQALAHRCEDIRRKLWGRAVPQGGRRMVQPAEDDGFSEPTMEGSQESDLREADSREVWRGLVLMIKNDLSPEDDVVKLLQLLEQQPDIFEEASGTRWPVRKILQALDRCSAPSLWSEDRVENAKRRLTNWVARFRRKNALDEIDLQGLFARLARQEGRSCRANYS
jgi:hypothetical protein